MEVPQINIEKMLDEYVERVFTKNFSFRSQQKEVILDIISSFMDGNCNLYVLNAPTGSGKSVIAMVVSGFLSEMKMKGYILASDLSLQSQYEKDFANYKLQWGSIKGVDNYECIVNHEKFSLGECKIKNVSYEVAETLPCFKDCGYLFNRRLAIKSPVTLLNYSFWLIQRNYVEPKMNEKGQGIPFPKRDFTICDEAHKVVDIVQNHFSPRIDSKTIEKLEKIRAVLLKHNLGSPRTSTVRLRTVINNLYKEDDLGRLYALLKEFEMQLVDFVKTGESIKKHVKTTFDKVDVPKEWKFHLALVDWAKDMHCKFEDYNHIISQSGLDNLIKNVQGDQVSFNCLDESYMMDKYFHSQAGFKLLMSATIGDPSSFLKNIGASDARYFSMESHFDFTESPIKFYPNRRMSMSQKEKTMPWLLKKIDNILKDHSEDSGIIHSGSYEISSRIFESLSDENRKRVLIYQGTKEKDIAMQRFLSEKNLVLMGPSLITGLDLKDDKSRFQILAKVPYPSLGDSFVRAKMTKSQDWYNWKTSIELVQGVGRSVRHESDWCITYVLDGCFGDIIRNSRSNFSKDFLKRIQLQD